MGRVSPSCAETASTCQTTVVVEHIGIDGIAQGRADSATGSSADHGSKDRPSDGTNAGAARTGHKAQGCPELRAQLGGPGYACGSGSRTGQRANGTAEFAGTVAGRHAGRSALGTVRNARVHVDARGEVRVGVLWIPHGSALRWKGKDAGSAVAGDSGVDVADEHEGKQDAGQVGNGAGTEVF